MADIIKGKPHQEQATFLSATTVVLLDSTSKQEQAGAIPRQPLFPRRANLMISQGPFPRALFYNFQTHCESGAKGQAMVTTSNIEVWSLWPCSFSLEVREQSPFHQHPRTTTGAYRRAPESAPATVFCEKTKT